jgi:hypothetical protein
MAPEVIMQALPKIPQDLLGPSNGWADLFGVFR